MAERALIAVGGFLRMLLAVSVIAVAGVARHRVAVTGVAGMGIVMASMHAVLRGGIAEILLANDHGCGGAGVKRQPQHHHDQQKFPKHLFSVASNRRKRKASRV